MATTQQLLDEARAAYHQLVTGKLAVRVVDQNGETVEFNRANKQALYDYIKDLEGQLGLTAVTNYSPAGFIF